MRYSKLKNKSERKFKRITGIVRDLFEILAGIVEFHLKEKHKKGGRNPKLKAEDILLLTLSYYRNYDTFFQLGIEFEIDESNAYRWIIWCESILAISFNGIINQSEIVTGREYLVDVMECTIQRPKDKIIQREYYSGKKKKHTIKMQIIIEEETKK